LAQGRISCVNAGQTAAGRPAFGDLKSGLFHDCNEAPRTETGVQQVSLPAIQA